MDRFRKIVSSQDDSITASSSSAPPTSVNAPPISGTAGRPSRTEQHDYAVRPQPQSRPSVRILRDKPLLVENPKQWFRAKKNTTATAPAPTTHNIEPLPPIGEKTSMPLGGRDAAEELASHSRPHAEKMEQDQPKSGGIGKWLKGVFGDEKSHDSEDHDEDSDYVDLLDVLDPEVSTLSTLTNVQNSLFVPSLGRFVNRRPAYTLGREEDSNRARIDRLKIRLRELPGRIKEALDRPRFERQDSLTSAISEMEFAVLPDAERLEGWTRTDVEELDDMVRHQLHSKRAKMLRSLKGFGQYVRRPLGLFITVYATLITLFGAAWVLFLIGWISLGEKKEYIINVVDYVLVALFAVIGDGLAPFRAVDTYHMIYIAHFYRKTYKIRRKLGLPDLVDHNDLPEVRKGENPENADIESIAGVRPPSTIDSIRSHAGRFQYSVLSESDQAKLEHHERKFSKSHTFFKPHETATHYAFPLKLLVAIVLLLDLHSALQISLGACTWGIPYEHRPSALTTVILCFSITVNILGGVLISVGDRRTRKKDVIEKMMRQELTAEAIDAITKRKLKQAEEEGLVDPSVRKQVEEAKDEAEWKEVKAQWKDVPRLPKKLLGKGTDHREPALPRRQRHGSRKDKQPAHAPAMPPAPEPATTRERLLRFVRRADMDMS